MLWEESLRGTSRKFFSLYNEVTPPWVPTTSFRLMVLKNRVECSVTMKQTSNPVNSKTQQKITFSICTVSSQIDFIQYKFGHCKQYLICENHSKGRFKSLQTLWNCNTNVKNILGSLARIFSQWKSF